MCAASDVSAVRILTASSISQECSGPVNPLADDEEGESTGELDGNPQVAHFILIAIVAGVVEDLIIDRHISISPSHEYSYTRMRKVSVGRNDTLNTQSSTALFIFAKTQQRMSECKGFERSMLANKLAYKRSSYTAQTACS